MKWISIIFVILNASIIEAQVDSVTLSVDKIIQTAETIQHQRDSIKLYQQLVIEQERQLELYQEIVLQDSIRTTLHTSQIIMLNGVIDIYDRQLKRIRPKWYESRYLFFTLGAGFMYLASEIVSNVK